MHEMDCSTMLAGRAFQGVGSGVILSLVEIVLSDLVPLSERYAPTSPAITLHSI
jgi:MFS family permease